MKVHHFSGKSEGFKVTVYDGDDTYEFTGEFREVAEDCGGYIPVTHRFASSTPVYKNGEEFLPASVTSALTDDGFWQFSWIRGKTDEEILQRLKARKQTRQS